MSFLRHHPFPVVAHFDRVVALSFAFPLEALAPLVPEGLTVDGYEGLGFVTVAMVWTRGLRPAGMPAVFGQSFFLAGYRIFTRLEDETGRRLRGLKIIRSETDRKAMVWSGNLMTGYNYRLVRVQIDETGTATTVVCSRPDGGTTLELKFDSGTADPGLPEGSPFPDWRTARRFAGPMPFTFSPEKDGAFVVIEGSRQSWQPRPVSVARCTVGLFAETPFQDHTPVLANAFMVEDVDYRWERGRLVKSGGQP